MIRARVWTILASALFLASAAPAADLPSVSALTPPSAPLGRSLQLMTEPGPELTADEVLLSVGTERFRESKDPVPGLGLGHRPVWALLIVQNQSDQPVLRHLVIGPTWLDRVGMPSLGLIHFVAALLAMALGAAVLLVSPKGGRLHRRLGLVYVGAMLTMNVTALMIYRLLGGFGPFHVFAIFSLLGIVLGWRATFKARAARARGDLKARALQIEIHYYWITWSYVGLLAAAASEALTRLPAFHFARAGGGYFGLGVAGATLVVVTIGAVIIHGRGRAALAPFLNRKQ